MKKLTLAYFGSPDFAAGFLEKLITDPLMNRYIEVKLVITQPDQKVGRKQILTPTPVKKMAEKYIKSEDTKFFAVLGLPSKNFGIELKNIDLALVYAYGDLIPKELLTLPKYGFWNIHPSLLPKYRGPSPIATPLINGDKITGVTIIKMDEEIDHGPIIAQESLTIHQDDKRPDLETKLTSLAFMMFKKTVTQLTGSSIRQTQDKRVNELKAKEQDHSQSSYTEKLSKQLGFISFEKLKILLNPNDKTQNPNQIQSQKSKFFNLFRGLFPWPGVWTILPSGKRLKITKITMKQSNNLTIDSVQLEGKNEVDFPTFNKAYSILNL